MELDKTRNRESGFRYPADELEASIRLLRLSPGDSPQVVRYSWNITPLDELACTGYTAVSYTWGQASAKDSIRTIRIDDQPFCIRRNLSDFLDVVAAGSEYGLYFIDAICINQLDHAERQSQVKYMEQIYRRADRVICWLGNPDPDQLTKVQAAAEIRDNNSASWSAAQIEGYRYLSCHPYWSRVWVVQEVLLSSRVVIRCGAFTVPYSLFGRTAQERPWQRTYYSEMLSRHQTPAEYLITHRLRAVIRPTHDPLAQGTRIGPLGEILEALRKPVARVKIYQSQLPDRIYEVIHKFGGFECSDPRDKLYGFLGILKESTRNAITADYSKDVSYAFYQALRIGLLELGLEWTYMGRDIYSMSRYYLDARKAFGITNETEGAAILRRVLRELHTSNWLQNVPETGWYAQSPLGDGSAGHVLLQEYRLLSQHAMAEEDMKQNENNWLFRFHRRQRRLASDMSETVLPVDPGHMLTFTRDG